MLSYDGANTAEEVQTLRNLALHDRWRRVIVSSKYHHPQSCRIGVRTRVSRHEHTHHHARRPLRSVHTESVVAAPSRPRPASEVPRLGAYSFAIGSKLGCRVIRRRHECFQPVVPFARVPHQS
jgi:hypothetical protein